MCAPSVHDSSPLNPPPHTSISVTRKPGSDFRAAVLASAEVRSPQSIGISTYGRLMLYRTGRICVPRLRCDDAGLDDRLILLVQPSPEIAVGDFRDTVSGVGDLHRRPGFQSPPVAPRAPRACWLRPSSSTRRNPCAAGGQFAETAGPLEIVQALSTQGLARFGRQCLPNLALIEKVQTRPDNRAMASRAGTDPPTTSVCHAASHGPLARDVQ